MYEKISKKITSFLIIHKCISESDSEIYIYSFQIILSTLISSTFILIWSISFNQVINTLFFFIGFFLCRMFSGGYHANSQIVCFVFTQIIFLTFMFIISFSNILENKKLLIIVTMFTCVVIFLLAPIDNDNKPFTNTEKLKFRLKSRKFVFFNIIIILFSVSFSFFVDKTFCYMLGILSVSIMIILGKIEKLHKHKFLQNSKERRGIL